MHPQEYIVTYWCVIFSREGHTGLYPILLLLGRLIPSLTDSKLGAFMPLLDRCAGSSLHGIRVASSKAYASLLPAESRVKVLTEKTRLMVSSKGKIGGNLLHGTLLQVSPESHYVHTLAIKCENDGTILVNVLGFDVPSNTY